MFSSFRNSLPFIRSPQTPISESTLSNIHREFDQCIQNEASEGASTWIKEIKSLPTRHSFDFWDKFFCNTYPRVNAGCGTAKKMKICLRDNLKADKALHLSNTPLNLRQIFKKYNSAFSLTIRNAAYLDEIVSGTAIRQIRHLHIKNITPENELLTDLLARLPNLRSVKIENGAKLTSAIFEEFKNRTVASILIVDQASPNAGWKKHEGDTQLDIKLSSSQQRYSKNPYQNSSFSP